MHTKKVAIVASYAPSLVNFRGPLIGEICDAGHEVHCLAPDFDRNTTQQLRALGAATMTYPLNRKGTSPLEELRTLRSLTDIFRNLKPDVVMGYTPKPAIYASIAGYRSGASHVVPMLTGLGYGFVENSSRKSMLIRRSMMGLYKYAFKRSHGVIFQNKDDVMEFRSLGLIPRHLPVHTVSGSGVDFGYYSEKPMSPLAKGTVFLMVARLVEYKGVREYCLAAAAIKKLHPDTRWYLAGPEETGPASLSINMLEQFGGAVEILGRQDDVRGLYEMAHVYVLPSYGGEGVPRTVLEAMATGRPIITTDSNGCRDTVDEVVNGKMVPVRDWQALADAMEFFVRHPDLIASMGHASRQKVERLFDVRDVNRDMMRILGLSRAEVVGAGLVVRGHKA